MRDRFFFPLALLLAVGMVWLGVRPAYSAKPSGPITGDGVNYDRIEISGDMLYKVVAGGDASTEIQTGPNGEIQLYLDVEGGSLADGVEFGPHFRLASDIETQFSGRRIRVTVSVQPAQVKGAEQVLLNYSAGRVGESGWQVLNLAQGSVDVVLEYKVPIMEGDQASDYLGIRPLVPEDRRGVIITKIVMERLPD